MWTSFQLDASATSRLTEATARDLDELGALAEGLLTRKGLVVLARDVDPMPPWAGFRVLQWPGALVDRPRLPAPIEERHLALPTLDMVDVLADEASVALGMGSGAALMDSVKQVVAEVLVNAVAHRDYGIDDPITVDQYTDALRITSPGPPAHARILNGSIHGTGARNPSLQYLLRCVGRGRQQGMGWARCSMLAAAGGFELAASVHGTDTRAPRLFDPAVSSVTRAACQPTGDTA